MTTCIHILSIYAFTVHINKTPEIPFFPILTGGHGTGNVGHLFGCSSNVTGDPSRVVAATAIKGLPLGAVWKNWGFTLW
jgi:hypothetical protein